MQKTRLILKTEAQVETWASALDPELRDLEAAGRISHHKGPIGPEAFAGTALVFVAVGIQ